MSIPGRPRGLEVGVGGFRTGGIFFPSSSLFLLPVELSEPGLPEVKTFHTCSQKGIGVM